MPNARISLQWPEISTIIIAGTALIAAAATLFAESSHGDDLILAFPLLPGLIAQLLLKGGHGGSESQEAVAPFLAAFVNALFYTCVSCLCRAIWRRLMARTTAFEAITPERES